MEYAEVEEDYYGILLSMRYGWMGDLRLAWQFEVLGTAVVRSLRLGKSWQTRMNCKGSSTLRKGKKSAICEKDFFWIKTNKTG